MKKTGNLRDSSKLNPLIFSVFFYPLRGHAGNARAPAALLTWAKGFRRFFCGKNERGSRCGAGKGTPLRRLHLIRFAMLSTFPSRGRLSEERTSQRRPLEGKLSPSWRLMRCSQPQLALSDKK